MVTGSVASMLYAEPRFTADVDVVARVRVPGSAAPMGPRTAPSVRGPRTRNLALAAECGVGGLLAEIRDESR